MATSFGQGCLYITRFEAQEQGIQWSNIWDSPMPNDNMSFAWCCIVMAIDGAIYFMLATYISAVINGKFSICNRLVVLEIFLCQGLFVWSNKVMSKI